MGNINSILANLAASRKLLGAAVSSVKFVGKLPSHDKLVYEGLVNYVSKHPIKITLRPRKNLKGRTAAYVDYNKLVKGVYDIYFLSNIGYPVLLRTLAHELTHIDQYLRGDLSVKDNIFMWKGKSIISVSEYADADFNKHGSTPWEEEAKRVGNIKSKEFMALAPTLLGGKDLTLDFMFNNDLWM